MSFKISLLFISIFILGCNKNEKMFEKMSSSTTNITFNNKISISDSLNVLKFEYIYNGGGVGIGDFNSDGLQDVFFTGNMVTSKLYLNKGNFTFEDISKNAGIATTDWCTGVAVVDINNDKKLDIYVSTIHPKANKTAKNLFFINEGNDKNGQPKFTEKAQEIGLADTSYSTQASFLDFDLDGDLDMYLLNNALEDYDRNTVYKQEIDLNAKSLDKLYENKGLKTNGLPFFEDVSVKAGLTNSGWGLGVIVNDFNNDGYPDIYASNDFLSSDHLYINNKNGTFTNKISEYFAHGARNSMGVDMADINNDGLNDLVAVDMLPDDNLRKKTMFNEIDYDEFKNSVNKNYLPQSVKNVLQLNNGNGTFSDIGYLSGIAATDWSWCPLIADFDNDGHRDIFITNGYRLDITDLDFVVYRNENTQFNNGNEKFAKLEKAFAELKGVKKPNFFFKNKGKLQFENLNYETGLETPSYSNGAAYADFDNDGDLDLAINNIDDEAFIYKNKTIENSNKEKKRDTNYLAIKLNGQKENSLGIGAKVKIFANGKTIFAEQQTTKGYKSSIDPNLHFGLGEISKIDSLQITWPNNKSQLLLNLKCNQTITINEKDAIENTIQKQTKTIEFTEASKAANIIYSQKELDYNDFLIQHTLIQKHSELGPGIAIGDVNNDGLNDFFIGGSAHDAGCFFIQNKQNTFQKKPFLNKEMEDIGVMLQDLDNDIDLDLYCVSGSTEFSMNFSRFQDRIYVNDGKGNFKISEKKLPQFASSGGAICAFDYDKDGDKDIFRSGRIVPNEFPKAPESYLLQNDGNGNFNQIIKNTNQKLGMISSAIWTDYNNDSWFDLVLVGEFMPVTFIKNEKGKLNFENPIKVENSTGLWNSVSSGDFDNDGDTDYIAGNKGFNSPFHASLTEPFSVFAKDFDQSGSYDAVFSHYLEGKEYPVHSRGTLIEQLISTRKRYKTFAEYGKTTMEELIPKSELNEAIVLKANNFATSYIENLGNGKFQLKDLPIEAQFSTVFGIKVADFNADGNLDVLMIGNNYGNESLSGRQDASIGNYFIGNGKGNFQNVSVANSGFSMKGDTRSLTEIPLNNLQSLLIGTTCNGPIQVYNHAKTNNSQLIFAKNGEVAAKLFLKTGKFSKTEFVNENGYLTNQPNFIYSNKNITKIEFFNNRNQKTREIKY